MIGLDQEKENNASVKNHLSLVNGNLLEAWGTPQVQEMQIKSSFITSHGRIFQSLSETKKKLIF
jgi:hypothetical protein